MANGKNAQKRGNVGKEWWGKRPLSGKSVSSNGMKSWKKILHKIERRNSKKDLNNY